MQEELYRSARRSERERERGSELAERPRQTSTENKQKCSRFHIMEEPK